MTFRGEPFWLSLAHLVMHWPVHLHAVPGVRDLVALAVWHMAEQVLHADSRREPEMNSSWEQAKIPGWRL